MKIRDGFVSNSSSSSFILATDNPKHQKAFSLFLDKVDHKYSAEHYFPRWVLESSSVKNLQDSIILHIKEEKKRLRSIQKIEKELKVLSAGDKEIIKRWLSLDFLIAATFPSKYIYQDNDIQASINHSIEVYKNKVIQASQDCKKAIKTYEVWLYMINHNKIPTDSYLYILTVGLWDLTEVREMIKALDLTVIEDN